MIMLLVTYTNKPHHQKNQNKPKKKKQKTKPQIKQQQQKQQNTKQKPNIILKTHLKTEPSVPK